MFKYSDEEWGEILRHVSSASSSDRKALELACYKYQLRPLDVKQRLRKLTREYRDLSKAAKKLIALYPKKLAVMFDGSADEMRGPLIFHLKALAERSDQFAESLEPNKSGSRDGPLESFLQDAMDVYLKITGKLAVSNTNGKTGGPLIRFLSAVVRPVTSKVPTANALKKVVEKYKKHGHISKHLLKK
jgi:hypothetical protein